MWDNSLATADVASNSLRLDAGLSGRVRLRIQELTVRTGLGRFQWSVLHGYTGQMDSVRFGRVLGRGARLAGRTLAQAVDAAVAPNPAAARDGAGAEDEAVARPIHGEVTSPRQTAATTARARVEGIAHGGRKFGETAWRPFARASGVLWLEVTGVFFGLVAAFGLQGVWTNRVGMGVGRGHLLEQRHLLLAGTLAVVFGYFCVSSFVRAARRGKQR